MEVNTIETFLNYYKKTREITNQFIQVIPNDKIDWSYASNKFTIADLVRHIAAIERNVFAEAILEKPICYKSCGKDLADGYDNVVNYFNEMHKQSMQIFKSLKDRDLTRKIVSLDGNEVMMGNFLRALIVHEIHHRGALSIYLNILGVKTPTILGFTEEQVRMKSKSYEK